MTKLPLTDLEIGLLELIEFGIDRWSAPQSQEIARGLELRGLIALASTNGTDADKSYVLTQRGIEALEVSKAKAAGQTRRSNLS